MAKGVAQHWIDNPVYLRCWCGKEFQQRSWNQKQCSAYHRKLASIVRNLVPRSLSPSLATSHKPSPSPALPDA